LKQQLNKKTPQEALQSELEAATQSKTPQDALHSKLEADTSSKQQQKQA
jgi:hypothetical protein